MLFLACEWKVSLNSDALAHVIFLFELEHRRFRLLAREQKNLLERIFFGRPLAGLLWVGWEKVPNWECLFVHRKEGLFLSVYMVC